MPQKLWFMLPLECLVERHDHGLYVARIPEVDDLAGWGESAKQAREDLANKVLRALKRSGTDA